MEIASTVIISNIGSNTRRTNGIVTVPGQTFFDQFVQESVELLDGDVGHHNDMGDVSLARQLPPADELLVQRSLENDGAAELVEHRADPGLA